MCIRDRVQGNSIFVSGMIILWSGTIASIPTGFVLCDGQNNTPDLRDKFIIGARQDNSGVAKSNVEGSLTQTGGDKDAVVVSHDHTVNHNHGFTTGSDGAHTHQYQVRLNNRNLDDDEGNQTTNTTTTTNTTQSSGAHTHSISGSSGSAGSSATNANLPPYYALCYIMKA